MFSDEIQSCKIDSFWTIKKFFRIEEIIIKKMGDPKVLNVMVIFQFERIFWSFEKLSILQLCISSETIFIFSTWCLFSRAQITSDTSLAGLWAFAFQFRWIIRNYFFFGDFMSSEDRSVCRPKFRLHRTAIHIQNGLW